MLSPQHLALARSQPHSNASTSDLSFLTPPVSGTPNMSPPPRHEAEDYMNVHDPDDHHSKSKHLREKKRKFYNTREGSEGSRPPLRSYRSGPHAAPSQESDCELCAPGNSDGDEGKGSNAPLIEAKGRRDLRNHVHKPEDTTEVHAVQVQTWPTLSSSVVVGDDSDSPAVNALRSHTLQLPARSNSQGLQLVSTALAHTVNLFKPKAGVSFAANPSRKASKKAEEASRRSSAHCKSLVYQDIDGRRPAPKDRKDVPGTLGTPATITLRKASNIYAPVPITTSMSASLTREREHRRAADAPASELLAFYSSPTFEKRPTVTDLSSPQSPEVSRSLKEQPTFVFGNESQSTRRASKSVSQCSDISNDRRCSLPAEAALTFADVHVAPGTFAVRPKSRKQSLVPTEFGRRISTIQILSRDSVHEVIWREDEIMSDSSFTASSGASQHMGHSFRSTPSSDSDGSPEQEPGVEQKAAKAALRVASDSNPMFTRMPENLFRWSWEESAEETPRAFDLTNDPLGQVADATVQAAGMRGDPLDQVLVISISDPDSISLQQSSDQQSSRSHEPSSSKLPSVQFFPPLRSRRSTAEWRKAPLVDLNDPLGGRVTHHQIPSSTHSAELGTGAGSHITENKEVLSSQMSHTADGRRRSYTPQAVAWLRSAGSVGSGIGASSHRRLFSRRKS